jgi:hypothetical protein
VTFESAYEIATLDFADRAYRDPAVCYGFGGYVHVTWSFEYAGNNLDASLRYRRCASFGGGGLAGWDFWRILTPDDNDVDEIRPTIAASQNSAEVMIAAQRVYWEEWGGGGGLQYDTLTRMSADSGLTWGTESVMEENTINHYHRLMYRPLHTEFVMGGWQGRSVVVQRAHINAPREWSLPEVIDDDPTFPGYASPLGFDIDFTRNQRLAVAFMDDSGSPLQDIIYFDAEWRRDPGYPNLEDGWPLELPTNPTGSPCLVDLDGNGDLEIIFPDLGNNIQVYDHDGTPHPGWPQLIGRQLAAAPVAVGDLNGDGQMSVVFGTTDGAVFVYNADGTPDPAFPRQMPTSTKVSVSLGALGGPYPRMIIALAGESIRLFNYRGAMAPDTWDFPGQIFQYPAAIGDIDGDGAPEIVAGGSDLVVALSDQGSSDLFIDPVYADICAAISLGDLNLDGDAEIVIPTVGAVHVWDGDGTDLSGFPVATAEFRGLSSVALAQILAGLEPELVVMGQGGFVDGFMPYGANIPGYPRSVPPEYTALAGPILGDVDGFPSETVVAAPGGAILAWDNIGQLKDGFPKPVGSSCFLTPAMGDIDQDGNSEIVFAMTGLLAVVDVGVPPLTGIYHWPMEGHNPARTSCLACPEDLVSAVEDPVVGPTRLQFSQPAPNPTSGPTMFSFELPVRAQVRVEVFNLRGQRVRTVLKEELPVGQHAVQWDGRNGELRPLASGVYFARLSANGPGLRQELTRKVNLLR